MKVWQEIFLEILKQLSFFLFLFTCHCCCLYIFSAVIGRGNCGSTLTFPNILGNSAFDSMSVPLDWLSHRIARWIYLPVHVVFLIKPLDRSVIESAGQWVNRRDRKIKKVKIDFNSNKQRTGHRFWEKKIDS